MKAQLNTLAKKMSTMRINEMSNSITKNATGNFSTIQYDSDFDYSEYFRVLYLCGQRTVVATAKTSTGTQSPASTNIIVFIEHSNVAQLAWIAKEQQVLIDHPRWVNIECRTKSKLIKQMMLNGNEFISKFLTAAIEDFTNIELQRYERCVFWLADALITANPVSNVIEINFDLCPRYNYAINNIVMRKKPVDQSIAINSSGQITYVCVSTMITLVQIINEHLDIRGLSNRHDQL